MSFKDLERAVVGITNTVMGENVAYTTSGAIVAVTIKAIFDNAWVDVEGVVSLKPTLRIRLADLSALPSKGDTVTISSIVYRIDESREDGHGGSTLILKKM